MLQENFEYPSIQKRIIFLHKAPQTSWRTL